MYRPRKKKTSDVEALRSLLEETGESANIDSAARCALMCGNYGALELLLSYGASPHHAAILPAEQTLLSYDGVYTGNDRKSLIAFTRVLKQPSFVHLISDHGGIWNKQACDLILSACGSTSGLRALRQVGNDTWCGGGIYGIQLLQTRYNINGLDLFGKELEGHTLQVRLRPSQYAALDAPLNLAVGTRVCIENGACGVVAGVFGAEKEGRYPVLFRKGCENKQIKPIKLRPLVDPGRAAVAGHEVDVLRSVVLGGIVGDLAFCNGVYDLNTAYIVNEFPVFTFAMQHLFCGVDGEWFVSHTADMLEGCSKGWVVSSSKSLTPLGLQWKVVHGTKLVLNPVITIDTPTWLNGSPPDDWIFRDARVESYNAQSHEHKLVFCDLASTSLHLRLGHLRFLDWDVLPRRRAAILAHRTVVTTMMIMYRMRDADVLPGTQFLSGLFRIIMRSTKCVLPIFREHMWPCVL